MSMVLEAVCALLLASLLFLFHLMKIPSYRTYRMANKIHGPSGLPVLGYSYKMAMVKKHELMDFMKDITENYPKLSRIWVLGVPHVVVQEPEDLEVLMGSIHHIKKGFEYFPLIPWLREGLLTSTGEKWHKRRKMLTNAFHFRILEDSIPTFNKNAVQLAEKLLASGGEPIDVDSYVKRCTLDVICEAANGVSLGAQSNQGTEYVDAIQSVSEIVVKRELTFWLHKDWMFRFSPIGMQFKKLLETLKSFTDRVISDRQLVYFSTSRVPVNTPKRRTAFLDTLLEVEAQNPGTLTVDDIREEVETFTFEGHDTTSASIVFTLFLLGHHPEIQERVAAEQMEIFGYSDRAAEAKDLLQMVYLEKVIKESLRLYPSVPYISRELTQDLNLAGDVVVPAGCNAVILPYFVHRNERFYPDPEKFDPERFNSDENHRRHPYAYIPFSAGPRNCIGQKFATMELKIVISTIIRRAVIESVTRKEDLKLLPFLILRPNDPIYIKAKPRNLSL